MRTALALLALALAGCSPASSRPDTGAAAELRVEQSHPALASLIAPDAVPEVLASGFGWSEGPVWIEDETGGYLLFSDVPNNTIHKWSEANGLSTWLKPASREGIPANISGEPGTNGLKPGLTEGTIIAADHGNRGLFSIDLATKARTALATQFGGAPFNSPNDLIVDSDGSILFTDPPYGLTGSDASPLKEQPHNGVYRLASDGKVTLLHGDFTKPNGIALSPDGGRLYVANSDPELAQIYVFKRTNAGGFTAPTLFFDATDRVQAGKPGLPDGMVVDSAGNLFATGPGGVLVTSPDGTLLGTIRTGGPVANVALGNPVDGSEARWLYMTAKDRLMRIAVMAQPIAAAR